MPDPTGSPDRDGLYTLTQTCDHGSATEMPAVHLHVMTVERPTDNAAPDGCSRVRSEPQPIARFLASLPWSDPSGGLQ
jgi:hypothetical protein